MMGRTRQEARMRNKWAVTPMVIAAVAVLGAALATAAVPQSPDAVGGNDLAAAGDEQGE